VLEGIIKSPDKILEATGKFHKEIIKKCPEKMLTLWIQSKNKKLIAPELLGELIILTNENRKGKLQALIDHLKQEPTILENILKEIIKRKEKTKEKLITQALADIGELEEAIKITSNYELALNEIKADSDSILRSTKTWHSDIVKRYPERFLQLWKDSKIKEEISATHVLEACIRTKDTEVLDMIPKIYSSNKIILENLKELEKAFTQETLLNLAYKYGFLHEAIKILGAYEEALKLKISPEAILEATSEWHSLLANKHPDKLVKLWMKAENKKIVKLEPLLSAIESAVEISESEKLQLRLKALEIHGSKNFMSYIMKIENPEHRDSFRSRMITQPRFSVQKNR